MAARPLRKKNKETAAATDEVAEALKQAAEEAADENSPFHPRTEEEVREEMEALKDLVQSELNKAKEANPDTDWEEATAAALAEKKEARAASKEAKAGPAEPEQAPEPVATAAPDVGVRLCECCEERPALPGQPYCEECMSYMRKHPFEVWQFCLPVLALMLIAFGITATLFGWSNFRAADEAADLASDHRYTSALSAYSALNDSITEEGNSPGWIYLNKQLRIYENMGIQEYASLNSFISDQYTASDKKKLYNTKVRALEEKIDEYTAAYDAFTTAATNATNEDLDGLLAAYDEEIAKGDYNSAYVNYYKYYACLVYGESTETQKTYVDAIAEEGTKYESLYLPLYSEIALNEQDYDAVHTYCNQLLELNKEDCYALTYQAIAYRMQGNLIQAAKVINDGLDANSTFSALNYQMAVICLLNDQIEVAESYAETAYNYATTSNTYTNAASLYALISELRAEDYQAAGNTDGYSEKHSMYETLLDEISTYGYEVAPQVEEILSGETTVQEIFTEGVGDFQW